MKDQARPRPLESFFRRIESLVEPPISAHRRQEFERLVTGFADLVLSNELSAQETALCESTLAFLSYKGAATCDTMEEAKSYFQGLVACGSHALRWFVRLLVECEGNDERMRQTFDAVPDSLRGPVVNAVLSASGKLPPELTAFCVQSLSKYKKMDPAHAEAFIEHMEAVGEEPTFAMVETLRLKLSPLTIARLGACTEESEIARAAEAFSGLLREAPADELPEMLDVLRKTSPPLRKQLAKDIACLLRNESPHLRRKALITIFKDSPKSSGKVAAHFHTNAGAFREILPIFTTALSRKEFHQFLDNLPGSGKRHAVMRAFCGLCSFDPVFVARALEARPGEVAQTMQELLQRSDEAGFLGWAKSTVAEKARPAPPKAEDISEPDPFLSSRLGDINGKQMKISGRLLEEKHFIEGTFRSAEFHDVVFKNCRFVHVDFRRASFYGCRFESCTFRDCDLRDALFADDVIKDLVFLRCDLCGAGFHRIKAAVLETTACICREIVVRNSHFTGFDYSFCDLSVSSWHGCFLGGASLLCSRLDDAVLSSCTFAGSDICDTSLTGSAFPDSILDAAELLHREDERLIEYLDTLDVAACGLLCRAADDAADDEAKYTAAVAVLDDWFITREIKQKSAIFLAENRRRLNRLIHALTPEAAAFFRLAPLLLSCDAFELDKVLPLPPSPMSISGYAPDLATLRQFRRHFPDADIPELRETPIAMEGLFTIGSCGSVAQTTSSDIDYWLIYDSRHVTKPYTDNLEMKLEAMSAWAMEVFDLEVHFFLMDAKEVIANNFGFSDEESSGSAQALLLKEEFYRTAVRVAGKMPVWWITGVDEDNIEHEDALHKILAVGLLGNYVDLGGVRHIPPEEFFGASLWQIVKALKSPFKSILKFGLLEKYISEAGGSGMLLCNSVKNNLLSGRTRLVETDPYMLLYREVLDHYIRVNDKDAAELVRMAFAFKTNLQEKLRSADRIMNADQLELALFTRLHMPGEHIAGPACGVEDWGFDQLKELDIRIRNFIIETYKRVREHTTESATAITPEDLTTLGRKIFAVYAKKENKVERLPFVSKQKKLFDKLVVSAEKNAAGQGKTWIFSGVRFSSTGERQALAEVMRARDPVSPAVYLTVNGLYRKGVVVDADHTSFPLSSKDTRDMLEVLASVFPPDETLNVDMKDIFRPEEVVKALFIINAAAPRDEERVVTTSMLYATNWGELFCLTLKNLNIADIENARDLVGEITEKDIAEDLETTYWTPERSRCILHPVKGPLRKNLF